MLSLRKFVIAFALLGGAQAFAPASSRSILARRGARPSGKKAPLQMGFDMEASIQKTKDMRLQHLEEQAMLALELAIENHDHPVFPNAMIAGDSVITHLLHRMGYLENGKVKVMVVDTLHLFPETMEFLADIEKEYNFKAEVFLAEGCKDKEECNSKRVQLEAKEAETCKKKEITV